MQSFECRISIYEVKMTDEIDPLNSVNIGCEPSGTEIKNTLFRTLEFSPVPDIDPFDPGPFYDKNDIENVINLFFDKQWDCYVSDIVQEKLADEITEYLNSKYVKRNK